MHISSMSEYLEINDFLKSETNLIDCKLAFRFPSIQSTTEYQN